MLTGMTPEPTDQNQLVAIDRLGTDVAFLAWKLVASGRDMSPIFVDTLSVKWSVTESDERVTHVAVGWDHWRAVEFSASIGHDPNSLSLSTQYIHNDAKMLGEIKLKLEQLLLSNPPGTTDSCA